MDGSWTTWSVWWLWWLCLSAHAPKAYGSRFMYLCICVLYDCSSDSSKVIKNQVLANAVQAQCNNISNLIVLDFWIMVCSLVMAWFAHLEHSHGMFQTSQMTNLLAVGLLASWYSNQYNSYSCWQQNYAVNMLFQQTESSLASHLASHNNLDTRPDCSRACFTTRSSQLTA